MPWETEYVPTTLETAKPEDIRDAVSLKCANCYGALSMANALGGAKTPGWDLCHAYPLTVLLAHAKEKGVSLDGVVSAVDKLPVETTMYYRLAAGLITPEEFKAEFAKWKNGG